MNNPRADSSCLIRLSSALLAVVLLPFAAFASAPPIEVVLSADRSTYGPDRAPAVFTVTLRNVSTVPQVVSAFEDGNIMVKLRARTKTGKVSKGDMLMSHYDLSLRQRRGALTAEDVRLVRLAPGQSTSYSLGRVEFVVDERAPSSLVGCMRISIAEVAKKRLGSALDRHYDACGSAAFTIKVRYKYSWPQVGSEPIAKASVTSNTLEFSLVAAGSVP